MILEPYTSIVVKRALNYQLKKMTKDVLIKKVESVDENFHARFSCLGRSYVYKIVSSPEGDGFPFESDLRWFVGKKLDVERMLEASQIFVGTHDFTTFSSLNPRRDPVRNMNVISFEVEPSIPYRPNNMLFINIKFHANAFLWHQV
eukprot:TRINITY_DN591_c0_g1_i17.p1 TRINITY_DN591_c0_g1~~TRINITY_DN591_c0_g1_i17.p1  ORF type:complete len:146 (-),score=17.05 TRINITY_DN591_c0_g1_i17:125-562(-)